MSILNLRYGLYGIAILILSCFISFAIGVSKGQKWEQAEHIVTGAKEVIKSSTEKEQVKHEIRKLAPSDIDRRLIDAGFMRDYDN